MTEIIIIDDGNMRCAHFSDFINLQESPAGFGRTDFEAVCNLALDVHAEIKRIEKS